MKNKKAKALKASRKPASEAEDKKYADMINEDRMMEEDPMGGTVIQGQQTDEWKKANPFQAAQQEVLMDRESKKAKALMYKGR